MPLYELRLYRRDDEVRGPGNAPQVVSLDLEQVEATRDLLNRHLLAAARRNGARDADAYEYQFVVREVDRNLRPRGDALFRWALPTVGEVPLWP